MSGREGVRLSTMRSDEGKVDRCLAPEVAVDCLDVNGGELSGFGGSSRIIIFGLPSDPWGTMEREGEFPSPVPQPGTGAGLVSRLPGPHGPALALPGHQGHQGQNGGERRGAVKMLSAARAKATCPR